MTRVFNPLHPGLTLRDDVLPAWGLDVTQAAEQLGVSRVALSRVLNGRAAMSPEMALRIEAWLGVEVKPACGWQHKAPMTCGRHSLDSKLNPCMFNAHQGWLGESLFGGYVRISRCQPRTTKRRM